MPYYQCLVGFQGKIETRKRKRLWAQEKSLVGISGDGSRRLDSSKLNKELGVKGQVQGEVWMTHSGWVPCWTWFLRATSVKSSPVSLFLIMFLHLFISHHIYFPSLFWKDCSSHWNSVCFFFSMLLCLPAVCIRNFTPPEVITGMITQYIQISAFEDTFHNYLS